jgi:hypothetical protein
LRFQFRLQNRQPLRRTLLVRIGTQLPCGDKFLIAMCQVGHRPIAPSELPLGLHLLDFGDRACAGDRPLGQTLAQFMMVWQR